MSNDIRPSMDNPAAKALIEYYRTEAEKGRPSVPYTLPLYSLAVLVGTKIDEVGEFAFYEFKYKDEASFFSYGQSQSIPSGLPAPNHIVTATDFHTNLTEASKTPENMDFAIELFCLSFLPPQFSFGNNIPAVTNPATLAAFRGETVLVDIGSTYIPPEGHSPYNLEPVFDSYLRQSLGITLSWGDGRTEDPLGSGDSFHDGMARTYLKAAGVPMSGMGLYQPEGHIWWGTKLGHDSKMRMTARMNRSVIVKMHSRTWPGGATPTAPDRILQWLKMSALGLGMIPQGTNA